jgi:arylsulfatase A-like enzyme
MIHSAVHRSFATYFFLIGIGSQSQLFAQRNKLPNIVFILTDDLGYGDVSILNPTSKIQTPNIDDIAKQGIVFTDAHSNSSVSTPTRYGILTGRYCWRTSLQQGVLNGYSEPIIPKDRLTIASLFKRYNYSTACIGKWHLGWRWEKKEGNPDAVDFGRPISDGPLSLGFDYFYGFSGSLDMPPYVYVENNMPVSIPTRMTENTSKLHFWRKGEASADFDHQQCLPILNKKATSYIEEKSTAKNPFFLYYAMPAPHTPILPTKEFVGKSGLGDYGDYVIEIDHMVSEIVKTLKERQLFENTIVIIASDNGCSQAAGTNELEKLGHFPSAGYRGYKADIFDGGHRVPFIISWPAMVKGGQVNSQLICTTDFMATFAEMTGYELKDNQGEDSFSFYSSLMQKSPKKQIRKDVVHHSYYGNFSIRKDEWKLLLTPFSGGWSFPQQYVSNEIKDSLPKFQLYNLKKDTGERNNVMNKYPEKVKELKTLMMKYISDGRSTAGKIQKNDVRVNENF